MGRSMSVTLFMCRLRSNRLMPCCSILEVKGDPHLMLTIPYNLDLLISRQDGQIFLWLMNASGQAVALLPTFTEESFRSCPPRFRLLRSRLPTILRITFTRDAESRLLGKIQVSAGPLIAGSGSEFPANSELATGGYGHEMGAV